MKIILVDDHDLFSMSLKMVLEQYEKIDTVIIQKKSQNLFDTIEANADNISLVLLDIHLKDENGLKIGKRLKDRYPNIPIFFLTGFDLIDYKYKAYEIGAEGFYDKGIAPGELYDAIIEITQNPKALKSNIKPKKLPLSAREVEVLNMVCAGKKHAEIADILDVSRRTVETLLYRIYKKLEVDNAPEAIIKCMKMGIIDLTQF